MRLLALVDAVADAIGDWQPPPELNEVASGAIAVMMTNSVIGSSETFGELQAVLRRLDRAAASDLPLPGLAAVMLAADLADPDAFLGRLERLAQDSDRGTALVARIWLSNMRENTGDPLGAIADAQGALELVGAGDGPWILAAPRAELAYLTMHVGDRAAAVEHARAALPVMQRLGAVDDEMQLRSLLASCAMAEGRLADAEAEVDRMERIGAGETIFGGTAFQGICRAELTLARGDYAGGLARYRECMARMREMEFPGVPKTGLEPWALFGASMTLTAHAHYAAGTDVAHGTALFGACRADALRLLTEAPADLDYPVTGMVLFALGTWGLLHGAAPADDAIRSLVLADRFAYNRSVPTMMWERITPHAEGSSPGRIAAFRAEYANRRPAELIGDACRVIERLPS